MQTQHQQLKEEIKRIIRKEMYYKGNLGLSELVKFYQSASPKLAQQVQELFNSDDSEDVKNGWKIIRHFIENPNAEIFKEENLGEGWKSALAGGLVGLAALAPMSSQGKHAHINSKPSIQKSVSAKPIAANKAEEIVAATLIGEAGGEGDEGMQAIMNVIMNRATNDFTHASAVCLKKSQFSMWNGKQSSTDNVVASAKSHSKWNKAVELVKKAEAGKLEDITGGADFYFNPKKAMPEWAKKFIKTKVIGNHVFYNHGKVAISKFF
jgi:hypothetical protein